MSHTMHNRLFWRHVFPDNRFRWYWLATTKKKYKNIQC